MPKEVEITESESNAISGTTDYTMDFGGYQFLWDSYYKKLVVRDNTYMYFDFDTEQLHQFLCFIEELNRRGIPCLPQSNEKSEPV